MRVTENTNFETIRNSLQRSKERMEDLQNKSTTMKKLNQPSDDPVGSSKVLELRTEKVNNDQFQLNAMNAEIILSNTDNALEDLSEILLRTKDIALSQASEVSANDGTRLGASEEINQLFQSALSIANRKVGERYIFGGFKTQKPPVDLDGRFRGDNGQVMIEVANSVFLTANITGFEAFNTHPNAMFQDQYPYPQSYSYSGNGNPLYQDRYPSTQSYISDTGFEQLENLNFFDYLQSLRVSLKTGNTEEIQNSLDRCDQLFEHVVAVRAKVGSRLQGLQSTTRSLERQNITNSVLSSKLEDADMAEVMGELGKEEAIFKSALASSKKLIQPTLLDFLR